MKVRDVMTKEVVTIAPDASFRDIIRTLQSLRISGLPVVSTSGAILGIVTEADLMVKEEGPPRLRLHPLTFVVDRPSESAVRKAQGVRARDVMTTPVITVDSDTDLREVARLMSLNGIKRVPVTEDDRLVGILTRADVLKSFLRPDEEIRREVIEDLIEDQLNLDVPHLYVHVADGIVSLEGSVVRRSVAELVAHLAERVDGVVGVRNELEYSMDDAG